MISHSSATARAPEWRVDSHWDSHSNSHYSHSHSRSNSHDSHCPLPAAPGGLRLRLRPAAHYLYLAAI
jgi:hypothetical protein